MLASSVCEVQWIFYLLQDLRIHVAKPTTCFCDSQSALAIGRMIFSINGQIKTYRNRLPYREGEDAAGTHQAYVCVTSANQTADGFTNPLGKS